MRDVIEVRHTLLVAALPGHFSHHFPLQVISRRFNGPTSCFQDEVPGVQVFEEVSSEHRHHEKLHNETREKHQTVVQLPGPDTVAEKGVGVCVDATHVEAEHEDLAHKREKAPQTELLWQIDVHIGRSHEGEAPIWISLFLVGTSANDTFLDFPVLRSRHRQQTKQASVQHHQKQDVHSCPEITFCPEQQQYVVSQQTENELCELQGVRHPEHSSGGKAPTQLQRRVETREHHRSLPLTRVQLYRGRRHSEENQRHIQPGVSKPPHFVIGSPLEALKPQGNGPLTKTPVSDGRRTCHLWFRWVGHNVGTQGENGEVHHEIEDQLVTSPGGRRGFVSFQQRASESVPTAGSSSADAAQHEKKSDYQ
mmetsp:Transcript_49185/g.130219  ORF Transcript_49185/g.130219 Transcript_49185/m.130219 type:complete len:365 (+) Transcript_49185:263-1357(+)